MFEQLTHQFSETFKRLPGQGRLTHSIINKICRDLRLALLEADVALSVVDDFLKAIADKAPELSITKQLKPQEALIKLIYDELVKLLGGNKIALQLEAKPPAVILLVGLQGSGKTTTVAKLAAYLKEQNKSVGVASIDLARPAAQQQLKVLADSLNIHCFNFDNTTSPTELTKKIIDQAAKQAVDFILIDTAGRLHIDAALMDEIREIHDLSKPIETLLVIDSMMGQSAIQTAKAFKETVNLTGIILTKIDGDARGGAALSVRAATEVPIKFMGVGEKISALEPFYPERIASRILNWGDFAGLVETVSQKTKAHEEKFKEKIESGKEFDLQDFLEQLTQMDKIGGLDLLLSKLPGARKIDPKQLAHIKKTKAIIQSMTPFERSRHEIIKRESSRKRRIADGCCATLQDVNRLLKEFEQVSRLLTKFSKKERNASMQKQLFNLLLQQ